jgi:hypothetical protein
MNKTALYVFYMFHVKCINQMFVPLKRTNKVTRVYEGNFITL